MKGGKMGRKMWKKNSLFVLAGLLLTAYISPAVNTATQSENISLRRVKGLYLDQLLGIVTPEAVSSLSSESKFVIHSGPSGVGQGTIKEKMLELYPGQFQRFLLYATRSRRGIELAPGDLMYDAVKKYYDSEGSLSREEVEGMIPDSVGQKEKEDLLNSLFPNWDEILADAPRKDIPSFKERVGFKKDDETGEDYIDANGNKHIMVYKEFNNIHYNFIEGTLAERTKEIFRLRDEEYVIVEPVRDYYQGLNIVAVRKAISSGDKIYILEGDRVWFDHVMEYFPHATSIFISPLSESDIRERMINILGEGRKNEVESINFSDLLRGGIERYIAEEDEVAGLINLPEGVELKPEQNKSFLAVKNSILALVGCQIHNNSSDVNVNWLNNSGLVRPNDISVVNTILGLTLNNDRIVEIAKNIYSQIEGKDNGLALTAMKVIISEQFERLKSRSKSHGTKFEDAQGNPLSPLDPQNAALYANIYVRSSQSPREFGGSFDYKHTLVNIWDKNKLGETSSKLTEIILKQIYQDIVKENIVDFLAKRDQLPEKRADVLLVLGSPDERVAYGAAELFKKGVADRILISGGGLIGDRTEADVFREILISEGIDPNVIITENKSKDTDQNMLNSLELLETDKIPFESIILLQKPLAQRRAEFIFSKYFPGNVKLYNYAPYIPDLNSMSPDDIRYALREIDRLSGFGIEIDENIVFAYSALKEYLEK